MGEQQQSNNKQLRRVEVKIALVVRTDMDHEQAREYYRGILLQHEGTHHETMESNIEFKVLDTEGPAASQSEVDSTQSFWSWCIRGPYILRAGEVTARNLDEAKHKVDQLLTPDEVKLLNRVGTVWKVYVQPLPGATTPSVADSTAYHPVAVSNAPGGGSPSEEWQHGYDNAKHYIRHEWDMAKYIALYNPPEDDYSHGFISACKQEGLL